MGDAWLQHKPNGVCDREIDYDDLGRWFRCASKVCQLLSIVFYPVNIALPEVFKVCRYINLISLGISL